MHRRNRIHRSGVGHWRFPTSSGDWITELNPPRSSTRSQCDVLLLFLFTEFSLFLSLFIGRAVHGNVMIDLDWTSPRPIIERHQSATVCEIPPFGIGRRKKKEKKKPLNRFSVSETWKIILKNNKNLSHIDWRSCRTGRWNRRRRRRADADAAADRCDADGRRPGRWSAVPSTWSHFLLPFILISWYSSWYGFDSFFITWKKNNCWTLKWVVLGFYRVGCVDWQRPLIGCFLFGRFFIGSWNPISNRQRKSSRRSSRRRDARRDGAAIKRRDADADAAWFTRYSIGSFIRSHLKAFLQRFASLITRF